MFGGIPWNVCGRSPECLATFPGYKGASVIQNFHKLKKVHLDIKDKLKPFDDFRNKKEKCMK